MKGSGLIFREGTAVQGSVDVYDQMLLRIHEIAAHAPCVTTFGGSGEGPGAEGILIRSYFRVNRIL